MLFNTVGSMAYYFCIWVLSVIIVRVAGYDMAGIFALATSVTAAPSVVSLFNMRPYQVSDLDGEYSNKTYIVSRILSNIIAVVFCLVMIAIGRYPVEKTLVIIAFMGLKAIEGFVDVYYGIEQKWQRLDIAGISMLLRGVASLVSFTAVLKITGSLLYSIIAMDVAAIVLVLGLDQVVIRRLEKDYEPEQVNAKCNGVFKLLAICTPIMLVAVFNNLSFSLPRIFLEKYHGEEINGIYASIASPTLVVQLAAQTLFAPVIPGLTRDYNNGNKKSFYGTLKRFGVLTAGLVIVALIGSKLLAKPVLVLLFGAGIADYAYLFIFVILISVFNAITSCFLYLCTLLRILKPQLLVGVAGVVSSMIFSIIFVQKWSDEISMEGTILAIGGTLVIQGIIQLTLIIAKLRGDWPNPPEDVSEPEKPWDAKNPGRAAEIKSVAVLMATYNGHKFLREQIDSIINQKQDDFEIKLYVRDDGSTDDTVEILREYEAAGKLTLYTGENKGFAKNFLTVMSLCDVADLYAFSDQDDIWEPGKIARAVSYFRSLGAENNKPQLYFANYEFYNEELTSHTPHDFGKINPNYANALVDCPALGCTQVFNNAARQQLVKKLPDHVVGHDCWTYMVCAGLGQAFCDSEYVSMKFRRHPGSASAEGMSFLLLQMWRIKIYFKKDRFADIRNMLQDFEQIFGQQISEDKQRLLALFTKDRYHISVAFKKVFYSHRFRPRMSDEIMLRVIALIGKI